MDPQLHFKGMEVWKQSHEKDTSNTKANLILENEMGNKAKLKIEVFGEISIKIIMANLTIYCKFVVYGWNTA